MDKPNKIAVNEEDLDAEFIRLAWQVEYDLHPNVFNTPAKHTTLPRGWKSPCGLPEPPTAEREALFNRLFNVDTHEVRVRVQLNDGDLYTLYGFPWYVWHHLQLAGFKSTSQKLNPAAGAPVDSMYLEGVAHRSGEVAARLSEVAICLSVSEYVTQE